MTLILDFDGVMSSIMYSGHVYKEALIYNLSLKTGMSVDWIVKEFKRARSKVLQKPWEYGWLEGGYRVTLGDEDPYVLNSSAAEELYRSNPDYRFCGFDEYNRFLDDVFHDSATKVGSRIDSGTADAVKKISEKTSVTIVSNGSRERICSALDEAGLSLDVHERTNKMIVRPEFDRVDRHLQVDSLRKIELRRPHYYEALQKLKGEGSFSDMTVVGDVLSLDLALPYHLGMNIVLKENPYTPAWSKRFVSRRGHVIGSLSQLLDFI